MVSQFISCPVIGFEHLVDHRFNLSAPPNQYLVYYPAGMGFLVEGEIAPLPF